MSYKKKKIEEITNLHLYTKQYDIETLIHNIDKLTLRTLVRTQELTFDFCIKYILDEKYAKSVEDEYIDMFNIVRHQDHLLLKDFYEHYGWKVTRCGDGYKVE